MLVKDIGEKGLLQLIKPYCIKDSIGDDGAIVHGCLNNSLVVTTDVLVDGVHFSDLTNTAGDVGWRSIAANLSDLAAMGALPLGVTVGLSLPPYLAVEWVEWLYQGMCKCLHEYNTGIIGGDITRSTIVTIAITALGQVDPSQTIHRHQAQVGDVIIITGYHGDSKGGLELLLDRSLEHNLTEEEYKYLITAHQQPKPRLDVVKIIQDLHLYPVAGMDSSDGLADAILQICKASGVGAKVWSELIPLSFSLRKLNPVLALDYSLYGGEDFELVLTMSLERAEKLMSYLGEGAAIIGQITREPEVLLINREADQPPVVLDLDKGFQHFSRDIN